MRLLLPLIAVALLACQDTPKSCPVVKVRFSPGTEITQAVVQAINASTSSVRMQAYSFTQDDIATALINAKRRQESVEVIIDRGDSKDRSELIGKLVEGGVVVSLDGQHPISHNKTLILDEKVVFTGSANFTYGAEKNAENSIQIIDPAIAKLYVENWQEHREHSKPYTPN